MSPLSLASLGKDKSALARALGEIEKTPAAAAVQRLLAAAHQAPAAAHAHVIGFTGTPGVGKSTLIGGLIPLYRRRHQRVAIIAVDPTSPLTRGAILGDRLRFNLDPADSDLFARSIASGGSLGGAAPQVLPFVCLLRALFDIVIIETVGIGQAEGELRHLADTMVLCLQPAAGDGLQFMKAGIMELPHIFCVNKADLPQAAAAETAALAAAATFAEPPPVVAVSAADGDGLDELVAALEQRFTTRNPTELAAARKLGDKRWLEGMIKEKFGSRGLAEKAAAIEKGFAADKTPFALLAALG